MKYCPTSGLAKPEEDEFCVECGVHLVPNKPEINTMQNLEPYPVYKKVGDMTSCGECQREIKIPPQKKFFCPSCGAPHYNNPSLAKVFEGVLA